MSISRFLKCRNRRSGAMKVRSAKKWVVVIGQVDVQLVTRREPANSSRQATGLRAGLMEQWVSTRLKLERLVKNAESCTRFFSRGG